MRRDETFTLSSILSRQGRGGFERKRLLDIHNSKDLREGKDE